MQDVETGKSLKLLFSWAIVSGLSTGLGAFIAVLLFPAAGFAQTQTGEYSIALFGFACLIGLFLGIAQYVMLRSLFLKQSRPVDIWLCFWIPATAVGVIVLIVPLYFFNAVDMLRAPWLPALIMIPGAVVLGMGQWLILRHYKIAGATWMIRTAVGTLFGASIGLITAFAFISFSAFSPGGLIEPVWACYVGLGLGLFQGSYLSKEFYGRGVPRWLIITAILVVVLIFPGILSFYYFLVAWIH